ncbi:hypothetical protein DEU56DRAFT_795428 [Suillus clintonianus]|uniref:uncharacterized protein n=1 Tax=Suillus clintonianus TaxID=1904413 RepID=UPI001B883F0C|nr:uncharacterized protein DEU56DRAFT_795428 [Suillus clintonianus]KAG2141898.1 hypothetical protein DEU56DRAFT_795428 [Suillus clintonianus]
MQGGSTANPGASLSAISESDIIDAFRNILARSRVIISADLETPYSCRSYTANCSVTESEDQSISAIINERQEQLDAVLHEISDLETVMDGMKNLHRQLTEKKDGVTQSMKLHKRIASGARVGRLPPEVISHIFIHCLPETSNILPPSKTLAPMLLTRICRRWRDIAVGMPSLWCRLRLYSDEVNNRRWEFIAFCYDLWLKRSRGLPLSLEVWCCNDNSNTKLRRFIQPYFYQIASLSIRCFPQTDKPELMFICLPTPQELIVCAYDGSKMTDIVQSMSQLPLTMRSLKITFPAFRSNDVLVCTPLLAHLTNIEVAIDYLDVVTALLPRCPNLSSLAFLTGVHHKMQPNSPITHTKLGSLRIAHDLRSTKHVSRLLANLSLPNLRLFEARYIEPSQIHVLFDALDALPSPELCELKARYARQWPHEQLMALLAQSNCPLESLVFSGGVMMTDEQRAKYVALIPSLEVVVSRAS